MKPKSKLGIHQRVQFNRETLQPYKSQAYVKFSESLYMDRWLEDADPDKKARAKEIQGRLSACRDRINTLTVEHVSGMEGSLIEPNIGFAGRFYG